MATNTWSAASAGNASVDGNWSLGHAPQAGEDIVFDGTSTVNCTFDVTAEIASFSMNTGYTGTVTQGNNDINIGAGGFLIQDGTFTGAGGSTYWVNCGGDWTIEGGTATWLTIRLNITDNSIITGSNLGLHTLKIPSGITTTIDGSDMLSIRGGALINHGTLILDYPLRFHTWANTIFQNTGIISGASILTFYCYNVNANLNPGVITAPVDIYTASNTESDLVLSITDNTDLEILRIFSAHPTYTATLDTNGHNLTCTDLILGDRGIINLGTGTHHISGSFDGVATGSDVIPGTSTVYLTGTGKTVELQSTDSLYNAYVTGSYTMNSDIAIDNRMDISGSLITNGNTLTSPNGVIQKIVYRRNINPILNCPVNKQGIFGNIV